MARKVIFLGSAIPESMINKHRTLSFNTADNIAQLSLLHGLKVYYGDDLITITEASNYNQNTIILDDNIKAFVVKTKETHRILYYLILMYGYIKKMQHIMKIIDPNDDIVIISRGPYIFVALPILLAKLKHKIKWIHFIITTVEVPEYKFPLSLISKMSKWTTRMSDGIITYVAKTATDYSPNKPYVEIVYSISEKIMSLYCVNNAFRPAKFTITYTGSFDDKYNTSAIVDIIKKTGNRYRWEFAGAGKDAQVIKELVNNKLYDVHFHGLLSHEEVVKLQLRSSLLLCLRLYHGKANEYYYKYAASAKLVEYLCSGVPILASDSPSNSTKIKPYLNVEKSTKADEILLSIEEIEVDYPSKLKIAENGRRYGLKYLTAEYQNSKIHDFIEDL